MDVLVELSIKLRSTNRNDKSKVKARPTCS